MRFDEAELRCPVPGGAHVVQILDVRERISLNDNQLTEVLLEVQGGPCAGQTMRDHFVTGGNEDAARVGRQRLLSLCRICGLELRAGQDVPLDQLIGRVLVANVVEGSYNGFPVPRVRTYRRQAAVPLTRNPGA